MSGLLRAVEQAMWRTFAATITTGAVVFLIGSVVALFTCGAAAATGNLRGMAAAAIRRLADGVAVGPRRRRGQASMTATANITRCGQCGDWAFMHDLCPTCAAPALTRYTPPTQHKKGA